METDQDMGHYERFLGQNVHKHNYMTMGQVYNTVLQKERSLEYQGKCVEGHIHVPEEIIKRIKHVATTDKPDVIFIEVGGTVGEYQNIMFFEAMRRFKQSNPTNVFLVHLVYLLIPSFLGEMKSKPAQASIYELYKLGLQPDFVVCRSRLPIDDKRKTTIASNTGVDKSHIIAAQDVDSIYKVPLIFAEQKFDQLLLKCIGLKSNKSNITKWIKMVNTINKSTTKVKIAIAGKYFTSGDFSLEDSYVCVVEAIKHACWKLNVTPDIHWFDTEKLEKQPLAQTQQELSTYDGIIVPQGWGSRGVEGKLIAVQIARETKTPYLGLCFGMQMAVIEYARNILGLKDANSEEINPKTKNPVIHIMPDQQKLLQKMQYGGTIRVGDWPCKLKKGTLILDAYEDFDGTIVKNLINERHRHRYEVNNKYRTQLEKYDMIISGASPDNMLVEAIELPRTLHPFFVGTQFHPEYQSRPLNPHPVFLAFINACKK